MSLTLNNTPHVNEAYCTAPLLSEADIEDDKEDIPDTHLLGSQTQEGRLYIVYLVDLAKRTSQCLEALFGACSDESRIQSSLAGISSWQSILPQVLQRNGSAITLQSGYWTSLIHLTYHTCQILLHRNGFRSPNRLRVGSLPSDAAVNIVRILEDMMSSGVLTISCLRTIPAVFASLSVQIANISGSSPDATEIAKHRARFCMLVLKTLQERWSPLLWYYSLFSGILHKMGCETPDTGGHSFNSFHGHSLEAPSAAEPRPGALWTQAQRNQVSDISSGSFMAQVLTEEPDYGAMTECYPFSNFLTDSNSGQSDNPFDQADP